MSSNGVTLAEAGFIHCCYNNQIRGVLQRFYTDVTEPMCLLAIDPDRHPGLGDRGESGGRGGTLPAHLRADSDHRGHRGQHADPGRIHRLAVRLGIGRRWASGSVRVGGVCPFTRCDFGSTASSALGDLAERRRDRARPICLASSATSRGGPDLIMGDGVGHAHLASSGVIDGASAIDWFDRLSITPGYAAPLATPTVIIAISRSFSSTGRMSSGQRAEIGDHRLTALDQIILAGQQQINGRLAVFHQRIPSVLVRLLLGDVVGLFPGQSRFGHRLLDSPTGQDDPGAGSNEGQQRRDHPDQPQCPRRYFRHVAPQPGSLDPASTCPAL